MRGVSEYGVPTRSFWFMKVVIPYSTHPPNSEKGTGKDVGVLLFL